MKRSTLLTIKSLTGLLLIATGSRGQTPHADPIPPTKYSISLGGRDACVAPHTQHMARADGGIIDVQTPSPNTIAVSMTGNPAAISYLGCTSAATQKYHLVQEFEITCSDSAAKNVSLTLDSTLTGFLRSSRKAGAYVRQASLTVYPVSGAAPPLVLEHPPFCASGTEARLCNQHLPPAQSPPMPLGQYVLIADFVLDTVAGGICNAHAAADFSPDTALPADFVGTRDPFQGVSKKSFGFAISLSAAAPSDSHSTAATIAPAAVVRTASRPASAPRRPELNVPGSAKSTLLR